MGETTWDRIRYWLTGQPIYFLRLSVKRWWRRRHCRRSGGCVEGRAWNMGEPVCGICNYTMERRQP